MTSPPNTGQAVPPSLTLPSSPYPGLRPFEKREWMIFFGREPMITLVIDRLVSSQVVVVHGDSGCGKSSLIRAGVLPQLELEHARSGLAWRTSEMRPGQAPLDNLAHALADLASDASPELPDQIQNVLNQGEDAGDDLAKLLCQDRKTNLCILVDQFEELFAFASLHGREEAQLLVDILVGLEKNPPPGLYVILTMRSEFLGVCARFKGLAETVNRTQYLLPQMEQPALIRAICEPALLYGGEVSRALAERLIADVAGDQDQLPLIQHGLMRLYQDTFRLPSARLRASPKSARLFATTTCSKTPRCRSSMKRGQRNRLPVPPTRHRTRLSPSHSAIAVQAGASTSMTTGAVASRRCFRLMPTR